MADNELEKAAKDPSTTSAAYQYMQPKWAMINTVLGGTSAMRRAAQQYLPQHPHESNTNYTDRLNVSTLLNMTELTLESLVGKPFSEEVKIDGLPDGMKAFVEDVDLESNSLHVFCRTWFRESLAKSFAHVLIEMPRLSQSVDGRQRTMADDINAGVRPYWTLISPENVIFASTVEINGEMKYDHVRIWETHTERYGFTEITTNRIRVLTPGWWELFEAQKDKTTNKVKWVLIDGGETGIPDIPLVTFYANHDEDMMGKPPLEDLGYLNIAHWQSTSDQRNILTVARFPMLAVSGAHDTANNDVMVIGPRQLLATRAENGKFYYVEHTGAAIESGAKDLAKLEQDMASYGAEFLRKRPGSATATARALDSAEATSPLQDMTFRFMDAVEAAFETTAELMNVTLPEGFKVRITTDFGPDEIKDVDMRTLAEMRRNRDLSRAQFVGELKRRGSLAENFDNTTNVKELQSEPQIQSPFATGFNSDGSGAGNVDNSLKPKGGASAGASGG